ncbi:DUF4062 domain-containing protein [Thalassotalea fonticola]|uniref:DUF4062 domain-containing protein n=1 Tax=Thalassotalea fonticola TaxID=3065649 RepID=A0ABZ0GSD6_9GAMM|nr:DUF4062 domain-containing protein [Colwelliaceae bacterium S1-1]
MSKKYQVFISSTYTDLIDERQSAVSAVLKAGHIPAGMELFKSGDQSQLTTIKRWIDESDIYMLILGGRYGSVEEESGLSYTELEYNYALESGKPLFAVVIKEGALDNKVKLIGRGVLEDENPKLLKVFREKVLSNISSFFDDEKDIRLCVHETLPDIIGSKDLSGWVRGDNIPDSSGLIDEISKLTKERNELVKQNAKLTKESTLPIAKSPEIQEFDLLIDVLRSTYINTPTYLGKEFTEDKYTVFEWLIYLQDYVIKGCQSNAKADKNPYSSFVFHTLNTRLQIHELTTIEKITGSHVRRVIASKKGLKLLAYFETKAALRKAKEKKTAKLK